MMKIVSILAEVELFNGFSPIEIREIVSKSSIRFKSYANGSIIISQGEKYDGLYILVEGRCISEITGYNGRLIHVSHLNAPFIVSPATHFSKSKTSPVTLRADGKNKSEMVQFIVIPEEDLDYLISTSALFTRNLLGVVSEMVISLSKRMSFLTLNTIEEKFMNYLVSLKKSDREDTITLPVSLEDLSAYFGVERPSLSRSISALIRRGLLKRYWKNGKISYRIIGTE